MNLAAIECPGCGRAIWLCTGRGERIYMKCAGCGQVMIAPVRGRPPENPAALNDLIGDAGGVQVP